MKVSCAKKQYEINGIRRWTEEDIYDEGCTPNSGISDFMDIRIKADSVEELITKLFDELGFKYDKEAMELNACGEDGRLDIQVMETNDGLEADKADLAQWKRGKVRLWLGNYTALIEAVTRETVTL